MQYNPIFQPILGENSTNFDTLLHKLGHPSGVVASSSSSLLEQLCHSRYQMRMRWEKLFQGRIFSGPSVGKTYNNKCFLVQKVTTRRHASILIVVYKSMDGSIAQLTMKKHIQVPKLYNVCMLAARTFSLSKLAYFSGKYSRLFEKFQ